MLSFFITQNDGYAELTKAGVMAVIILALIIVLLIGLFMSRGKKFSAKELSFAGNALAVAFALSFVKLFHMPWGGSVTLLSMLFVVLIGYWYGLRVGLTAAFAYGLLQFVQGGGDYILSFWQVAFDYLLAFTALGLSGLFSKKKNGLLIGYLVAVAARGLFHSIGGYLYWMEYMPENFPQQLSALYPILYNYAYILAEAAITVIVISLPPVKKALESVKKMALE
ncbi:MAG: energy-coupled thiamine transporter ThiT [Lachnospiraceae bacterium]|nr:energy-coupled thiamine transporter ThiT [Lachnospiraceae bacterium]